MYSFHCSEKMIFIFFYFYMILLMFFSFSEPTHVVNLKAEAINTTFVNLTWSYPADHKESYSYEAEVVGVAGQSKSTTGNSIIFDNLQPGTNYTFKVITKANNQLSQPSEVSSFTSKSPLSLSGLVACCHTLDLIYYFLANWSLGY